MRGAPQPVWIRRQGEWKDGRDVLRLRQQPTRCLAECVVHRLHRHAHREDGREHAAARGEGHGVRNLPRRHPDQRVGHPARAEGCNPLGFMGALRGLWSVAAAHDVGRPAPNANRWKAKRRPRRAPSPFLGGGEKVAAGRMRGGAAFADARNPSPRPSPLLRGRERESAGGAAPQPFRRIPSGIGMRHGSVGGLEGGEVIFDGIH